MLNYFMKKPKVPWIIIHKKRKMRAAIWLYEDEKLRHSGKRRGKGKQNLNFLFMFLLFIVPSFFFLVIYFRILVNKISILFINVGT